MGRRHDLVLGEGSKTIRQLAFTNSDPAALRVFRSWPEGYLDAAEFVLSLHLHHGNDEAGAKRYWERELDLPGVLFWKTHVKPPGTGHRNNRLSHGVCRVSVRRSTDHFVRTMAWIDALAAALT